MAGITLSQVHKSYGKNPAVIRNVNLDIPSGEFCVFIGPSGCGKSTLLRMIAGLEDITSGSLHIGGKTMNNVAAAQRGVAMVFQSYALFPHMTVFENIAFGLRINKTPADVLHKKVHEAAAILQLEPYLDRLPKALSGGQRQRVAIGRAIVRAPEVFLFDEPLSNLDAALRAQTRYEIAKIHRHFANASTVYVTHDQTEAMTLADRILLLNSGDALQKEGSIAQIGSPLALYHTPRNLFVAGFIGSPTMNFLPARVVSANENTATVQLEAGQEILSAAVDGRGLQAGASVTLGIRAEDIPLSGQGISRNLQWLERVGDSTYLYLDSGNTNPLVIRADGLTHYKAGERIAFSMPIEKCHVFDENGIALARRLPEAVRLALQ